jgi:hypothetical protein
MPPPFSGLLKSWADEFQARSNRIRQLIGDAHWLSDGTHKESLVQEFLQRHLSPKLSVGHGFIRPVAENRCCSPEIDVLISDFAVSPPFFNEGQLTIVSPMSVVAHVQCKSDLQKTSLTEGIANIVATQHTISLFRDCNEVWRGIVFTSCPESRTQDSIADTIQDVIGDFPAILGAFPDAVTDRPSRLTLDLLPKCLAEHDRFIVFFSAGPQMNLRIRVFDTDTLGCACFMCDLFSHLAARESSPAANDLAGMIETLGISAPAVRDLDIC